MSSDDLQAALATARIDTSRASPEFLSWLGTIDVPPEVVDLLRDRVPGGRKTCISGRYSLYSEREIRRESEDQPRYLRAGLLAVGYCPNGDPIAIDLRKRVGSVGYLSHDVVWEDEGAKLRRYFVVVAASLPEFVRRACEKALPIDYWEAKRTKRKG